MSQNRQPNPGANVLIANSPNQLLTRQFELQRDEHDEPHAHPWHQLLLPRSGMLRTRTQGNVYFVPGNRAALIPAGVTHESWALTPARFAGIYFDPEIFPGPLEDCRIIEVTPFIDALIVETLILDAPGERKHTPEHRRMIAVLMDRLSVSPEIDLSVTMPDEKRLQPIVQEILTNPASNRSVSSWARTVGASERTISRQFKRQTGLGFVRWRQKVRMISALSLLEEGHPVQETAHEVGYSSASAFIHCFRKEFGITPQQYRASAGNPDTDQYLE